MTKNKMITIKDLKEHLQIFPDDMELYFGGLEFYRVKDRGCNLLQVEFNQTVSEDSDGNVVVTNH